MIDFSKNSIFKLKPVDISSVKSQYEMMLVDGETILHAFSTVRDSVVFTNKRVIACNVQGFTGKKKDYTSLPYSRVQAFSVESAGTFDLDCEIDLWFSSVGKVRFEITGSFDVHTFNLVLSSYIL